MDVSECASIHPCADAEPTEIGNRPRPLQRADPSIRPSEREKKCNALRWRTHLPVQRRAAEAAPIKQLEPNPEPQPKTKTKKEPQLHAATEARLSEAKKSKATIKGPKRNPAATPPNRKKISPPESKVLKIDHIFPPVDLDKDGTPCIPCHHPATSG